MGWFWSPSKAGFYNDIINVPTCANPVPADAVPITEAERQALLDGQATGLKRIVNSTMGTPMLEDVPLVSPGPIPPTPTALQTEIEALEARLTAAGIP